MSDKFENMTVGMVSPEAFDASLLVSENTVRLMHDHTVPLSVFSFFFWHDIIGAVWWKGLFMTLSSSQHNFHIVPRGQEHERSWTNTLRRAKKTWQGRRNCDSEENTLASLTSTNYTFRGRLWGRVALRSSNGHFFWWSQIKGCYRDSHGWYMFRKLSSRDPLQWHARLSSVQKRYFFHRQPARMEPRIGPVVILEI